MLSEADQADQVVQALLNMLQEKPQAGQKLQEALEAGDIKASFMGRLLTVLQQSEADGAQMSSLQIAEAPPEQSQHGVEGQKQVDIAGSDLLSALLSQMQKQNVQPGAESAEISRLLESVQGHGHLRGQQLGCQSLDSETSPHLRQLLEQIQTLLSREKGQVQNPQAGQMGSQNLGLETRTELGEILHRMQVVLGRSEGQGQNNQATTQSAEMTRLLDSVQSQGQLGSQSLDSQSGTELEQLVERMQALLGGQGGQFQNSQAGQMGSQNLGLESRTELGEILHRMQVVLGRSEGQGQNNQVTTQSAEMTRLVDSGQSQGQLGSQPLAPEARAELQQLLQRIQALLGQSESKGQAGTGQKALHVEEGGYKSAPEGLRASQTAAVSQPASPQPAPNRGLGYYLQSYQGAEQAGGKGVAQTDFVAANSEGQTSGGSKEGLSGQGRSLAEAMFQQNIGGKGQTGTGSGNQFGLTLHNTAETGTGSGSGAAATFTGSPGSSAANSLGGQGASQAFGTQQAFEQSMVDQVRFRMSQGMRSGQQEVVVRMHPRELGEVRLSLTSDDGNLRAHLHVQSQQVQDVLERNISRLRETLAEQGIDVEDFVFSSQDQGQEAEHRTFEQEKWAGGRPSGPGGTMPEGSDVNAKNEQAGYRPEQGLSVRI